MTDTLTPAKRSYVMSRIRSEGTSVEITLYRVLRQILGEKFRIIRNVRGLPGKPDFLIPRLRLVILVHGCFYHACRLHGHIPKTHTRYWTLKLARNARRDKTNESRLRRLGFSVWTIWEHALEGSRLEPTRFRLKRRFERMRDRRTKTKAAS
jgi:DNA mismatch endonuclease (patch repair protein)